MNFSDPILISQGDIADQVQIKLLKSYFMRPSTVLAALQNRGLSNIIEDEEYVTILKEIPRQIPSKEE